MSTIQIPDPIMQVDFSYLLGQARVKFLQDALSEAIADLELRDVDRELSEYVPSASLKTLAKHGLRGELLFPVPTVLRTKPTLVAYYRLLLGFSQKEFYTSSFGVTLFKSMEVAGKFTARHEELLPDFCRSMIRSCCNLLDGVGEDRISLQLLDDLTLLTLGPQFRGGANVKRGEAGIVDVFKVIHGIVEKSATSSTSSKIELRNAAGRLVVIAFAADPDIVITEQMEAGDVRNIIAIEVKAGRDFSNIHNRIGEAEKSHQKAKQRGYVECWTVVNVDKFDYSTAAKESPTTNRFYRLSSIKSGVGDEFVDFHNRIISLTGVKSKKRH